MTECPCCGATNTTCTSTSYDPSAIDLQPVLEEQRTVLVPHDIYADGHGRGDQILVARKGDRVTPSEAAKLGVLAIASDSLRLQQK